MLSQISSFKAIFLDSYLSFILVLFFASGSINFPQLASLVYPFLVCNEYYKIESKSI